MSVKVFVDTNILVYCRDASEPEKQHICDCGFLLTEDLQGNQVFGDVRVIDPFIYLPEKIEP